MLTVALTQRNGLWGDVVATSDYHFVHACRLSLQKLSFLFLFARTLKELLGVVEKNVDLIERTWNEHFGHSGPF